MTDKASLMFHMKDEGDHRPIGNVSFDGSICTETKAAACFAWRSQRKEEEEEDATNEG